MHRRAAELISTLGLTPHTEGGYFSEIYRSASVVEPLDGRPQRAALTVIYFLLTSGDVSRWHRVLSDEAWHFLEGDPLELHVADPKFERVTTSRLGPVNLATRPVVVVEMRLWQAAQCRGDFTLVGCTVGPGFEFADFELLRDLEPEVEWLRRSNPAWAQFL